MVTVRSRTAMVSSASVTGRANTEERSMGRPPDDKYVDITKIIIPPECSSCWSGRHTKSVREPEFVVDDLVNPVSSSRIRHQHFEAIALDQPPFVELLLHRVARAEQPDTAQPSGH